MLLVDSIIRFAAHIKSTPVLNHPFSGGHFADSMENAMITLIATVLNEGGSIRHLMDSIKRQTRQPDEIVIVDGGSQDDTLDIMRSCRAQLPLRLLVVEGCNISQGRNHALAAARGDIIAVTDAGVRLADDWLENITRPLLDRPDLNGVGGFFQADPRTAFEAALGAATLPLENEIDPQAFLPSSRSTAFRKTAAEAVGGYPEWLDFCEDVVFDRRLRAKAGPFAFAPGALAHFRPRRSLTAFWRQYFFYARGDGKARLWGKRHLVRYSVYLLLAPLIFLLGLLVSPLFWSLYALGGAVYLWRPYRRLPFVMRRLPRPSASDWLYGILMIPIIRAVGDLAKMAGYPVGRHWRWRHRPPDWRL